MLKIELLFANFYFMFCVVENECVEFILVDLYIPPIYKISNLIAEFEEIFTSILEKFPNIPFFIGGDFNCRVHDLNNNHNDLENSNFYPARSALDKTLSQTKSKESVESFEANDLILLNERSVSDSSANFTYFVRSDSDSQSTIDLVWCSLAGIHLLCDLHVKDIIAKSDHFPVILELTQKIQNNSLVNFVLKLKWDDKLAEQYVNEMRDRKEVQFTNDSMREMSDNLVNTIVNVTTGLDILKKTCK